MSTENEVKEAAEAQPTVGEVLFFKAYVPKFIKECSARGVDIQTEDELINALRIADRIRMAKAASAQGSDSLLKQAADSLDAGLGKELEKGGAVEAEVQATLQDPIVASALEAIRA